MTTELTAQQQRAIDLLIRGKNVKDTAKELGICRESISRWRALPEFMEAFDNALEEIHLPYKAVAAELYNMSLDSLKEILIYSMNSKDRMKASVDIIRLLKPAQQIVPKTPSGSAPKVSECHTSHRFELFTLNTKQKHPPDQGREGV